MRHRVLVVSSVLVLFGIVGIADAQPAPSASDTTMAVVGPDEQGAGTATVTAPAGDSTLTWAFHAENVRDFAFGTSDAFVWDATSAETGTGTAMIHAFYRPDRSIWPRSAEFARFSIEHLSDMIVPYPYPHMTTVEGPIGGGMEYPMITHIGQYNTAEGLFGVTYHEISHMWFPMMVGTDEKTYAWFDEGTTTFNETEGRVDFFPDNTPWARSEHYYFRLARAVTTPSMRHADRYPGSDRGLIRQAGRHAARAGRGAGGGYVLRGLPHLRRALGLQAPHSA